MSYPLAPRSYCGGADPAGVGTSELTEMFLRLKQDYPYQPSPDVRNPYTGDLIDSEARYDEFLRELAYRMVCSRTLARNISPNMIRGMYEDELRRAAAARKELIDLRAEKQADEKQHASDTSALQQQVDDAKFHAEEERIRARKAEAKFASLQRETDELRGKLRAAPSKRTRIVHSIVTTLSLILSVVLIIVLATAEPDSSVYQRGFDSGHASGYVEGKNDEATPAYNRGYAAGKESGYINGRNKGYWEGKQYMQQYIDELQEELRDYRLAERGTESGRIIGKEYLARHSEPSSSQPTSPTSASYIANMSTGKFHRSTCSYLPDTGNRAYFYSAEAARAAGYSPCGHCNP